MTTTNIIPRATSPLVRPSIWLALGGLLTVLANLRWGIDLLGWVAPIPLLRYLRVTRGVRSRALFAATLALVWVAIVAKIVTAPVPPPLALLGVFYAIVPIVGYLGADTIRSRIGDGWGVLAFPVVMTLLEWVQHRATDLASWGAAAYTQLDDLPLLQIASVTGMAGVSFLVYWVASSLEAALSRKIDGSRAPYARGSVVVVAAAVVGAHVFGAVRLAQPLSGGVVVAAIGTHATFTPDAAELTPAQRSQTIDELLASTEAAARAGARLATWTEGAALVLPEEEASVVARIREGAMKNHIHIVAAYVLLLRTSPVLFENKYQWVTPDGVVDHTYLKHRPVPGEPAVAGSGPLATVDTPFGRLGGAICYDYDFPALGREHGLLGVDLVALPASDWRGIDPIHTEMAKMRAVEDGLSIVRSTRFGLSAGIDPHGRLRAWQSSFDTDNKVLVFELPQRGIRTVYVLVGDIFVYACFAAALALGWAAWRRGKIAAAAAAPWRDATTRACVS